MSQETRTPMNGVLGPVRPHQLRHTVPLVNRGMRMEAIVALMGHLSMAIEAAAMSDSAGGRRPDDGDVK